MIYGKQCIKAIEFTRLSTSSDIYILKYFSYIVMQIVSENVQFDRSTVVSVHKEHHYTNAFKWNLCSCVVKSCTGKVWH